MPGVDVDVEVGLIPATDEVSPSKREFLAREAAKLVAQQQRVSVRDLASKFERGQQAAHDAAGNLAEDEKLRNAVLLDRQELLTKLRSVLEVLAGRVAGRNKDDVDESLTLVEALGIQLVQREIETSQDTIELRKMATLFKQASTEARKMVEEARSVAQQEIEKAKDAVVRVESMLDDQERSCSNSEKAELERLKQEVQEARRIKMLHEPSKVMDMDYKLQAMKQQLDEKSAEIVQLRKELDVAKHGDSNKSYSLDGEESLGSFIRVRSVDENAPRLPSCTFQWHRISPDGGKKELISGAAKPMYAPEPFDVGRILRVDITLPDGSKEFLSTTGPIDPAPGLGNYVEALAKKGSSTEFNVVIVQENGKYIEKHALHALEIGRLRMKLRKGLVTKMKEKYAVGMQLCGARGGGQAAPLAMYLFVRKNLTYMMAFESERERNAAIMLARRFAFDCNVMLAGPDDRGPLGTS